MSGDVLKGDAATVAKSRGPDKPSRPANMGTEIFGPSDSGPATVQPPRRRMYPTRAFPFLVLAGPYGHAVGAKTQVLRGLWQERFPEAVLPPQTPAFAVIKSSKGEPFPFPKQADVDTYRSRPTASARSPSQEASGRDRSASSGVRRDCFGTGFLKAAQRFNAGWSSPVARQAHNLKVIGSNPIPATKT